MCYKRNIRQNKTDNTHLVESLPVLLHENPTMKEKMALPYSRVTWLDSASPDACQQARSDARSAVEWYNTNSRHESEKSRVATACAYLRLGQALLAEPKHADQDAFAAAKVHASLHPLSCISCDTLPRRSLDDM